MGKKRSKAKTVKKTKRSVGGARAGKVRSLTVAARSQRAKKGASLVVAGQSKRAVKDGRVARAKARGSGLVGGAHPTKPSVAHPTKAIGGATEKDGEGRLTWLTVAGARQNNLKNITVEIPLARFVCVTGVSGSGKSSLVNEIIAETLTRDLNGAEKVNPGLHDRIDGLEHLDKIIVIDQSPIGRTPRSNPATYIKVFDEIRSLFTKLPDAKVRGYKPGRFSFNVSAGAKGGGRCEACEGNGQNRIEMDFLADVWVMCPVCEGRRFTRETLQIVFKGKSIADVLDMDVQEAMAHFDNVPKVAHMLRTLHDVGLDYLKLGQSSTTLSGGEAQRIKLARELVKRSTGRTLYVFDEPTTGLHFDDIKKLLAVLHRFVDEGNTVLVIEHNLDVVKTADWVIDLGPEGGVAGGRIVAKGTPERVANVKKSYTGMALREVLDAGSDCRSSIVDCRLKERDAKDQAAGVSNRQSTIPNRQSSVTVVGAKQHNLKDITVSFPRGKMTVCSGPSGSGKSSFAIDTVYTEGQRRYVESLSAYARQFLSRLQPPKVDHVHGLSPAVCIEQKNTARSPRSTVGTITEIYDYLRVLWARVAMPYCPTCRCPVGSQTSEEIVERVLSLGDGRRVMLLAPVERTGQETYERLFERERANGYARVRIDGVVYSLSEAIHVDARQRHRVELVVDRIIVGKDRAGRITDSVEQALAVGNGVMYAVVVGDEGGIARKDTHGGRRSDRRPTGPLKSGVSHSPHVASPLVGNGESVGDEECGSTPPTRGDTTFLQGVAAHSVEEHRFSQRHSCQRCGCSFEELTPHHFSFNARMGWCEACEGLGVQQGASASAIVVHPTRSIADGAIGAWGTLEPGTTLHAFAAALARHLGVDLDTPWNEVSEAQRLKVLHGCGTEWIEVHEAVGGKRPLPSGVRFKWRGFFPAIHRATRASWQYRKRLEDLVTEVPCDACAGGRLQPEPSAARLVGKTIHEVCLWSLDQTLDWFDALKLSPRERKMAGELIHEIRSRLRFLVDVGLDYVTLHRSAATLSGGESQRIQLASQIGTGLTGVLYVLDEPTIGLHPRDNGRLIAALKRLRDLGNTLLLVEHDRDVIQAADHILDFGPVAGAFGGEITAATTPKRLRSTKASLTGRYLSQKEAISVPSNRREVIDSTPRLTVHGGRENNLKEIDAAFPLGRFTCVTGVSGSGKSTLVSDILYNALAARIHRARLVAGGHERITGIEHVDKVINVDQSPIGMSPKSNPATYTGVFDLIRELFARLPLSKIRGYSPNRFSFNRPGGRCEACEGMGLRCIEMHFLPDVWVECESCGGQRFVPETLEVRFRDRNIADVLNMRITEALGLFQQVPKVRRMLQTLDDVGLGYVQLGQSAPTLSGGEAQRVKLASELGRPSTGKTLYILDEPTTGLHFDDLKKLLAVLHRLVDLGNTCICIEHNLDVIKTADWIVDLGPEAGDAGGRIVVEGSPELVAATKISHTGVALAPVLKAGPVQERVRAMLAGDAHRTDVADEPIDLGDDMHMPWERDGRRWHTVDHVDAQGEPVQWDAELLEFVIDTVESVDGFRPTDWKHRTRIEITATTGRFWFLHALTGGADLLDLAIRVPDGTFHSDELCKRLGVKTLDERGDLPIYGQWARVRRRALGEGWQEWRLHLRDFKDVSKTTLRGFLKEAARAYVERVRRMEDDPASAEPWRTDGRKWHLSQKSINQRHTVRWKPATLMALLGRFQSLQGSLENAWGTRTSVQLRLPGESRYAAKIVTNMGRGLRVELLAPRGALTPTMIERLGESPEIKPGVDYDRIVFWLRGLDQNNLAQLRDVWRRCRGGDDDAERLQSA